MIKGKYNLPHVFHADIRRFYVEQYQGQENQLSVEGKYVGGSCYEVDWIMKNPTDYYQFVGLVRGAVLEINNQKIQIPDYLFGNAFADVYYSFHASQYITTISSNIPLYSLVMYAKLNNNNKPEMYFPGFIFVIPPHSQIVAPECGFVNLISLTSRLVTLSTYAQNQRFLVIYNLQELLGYEKESGLNLGLRFPAYTCRSAVVVPSDTNFYIFDTRIILNLSRLF